MARLKITSAGQVSVPAAIRRRWDTSTLTAEDRGDHIVLRPAADDPIDAVAGIFAERMKGGPPSAELRRRARQDESDADRVRRKKRG